MTGANRGIGLEIARQLATAGLRVILGSRDEEAGLRTAEGLTGDVRVEQLDVSDQASVDGCAERLAGDGVEVDVVPDDGPTDGFFYQRQIPW